MKNEHFEYLITSPYDREHLVCEIYYKKELFAEISNEANDLKIEIYASSQEKWWQFSLNQFQNAIETAKKHLLQKE